MRICPSLAIALLTVAGGAGCKPLAKPCASMSASASALAKEAAVVRLDVYGSGAHCRGATIAPGAPPPAQSQTVSGGKPLTVDVPAGHHVLLLSAFRDAAGTELLGSACTETNVVADQPACFELKLIAAPDGAVPVVVQDLAMMINDMASSDLGHFVACSAAPDNCPAGQYCASNGSCTAGCKADVDCAGNSAMPRCRVADHQCVACVAATDCAPGKLCSPSNTCVDGCDPLAPICPGAEMCCSALCTDTTSDAANCGSCGHGCTLAQATSQCTSSTCAIKTCNAGYADCNGTASDGCECGDPGDARHGCCPSGINAGKCEGAHGDGLGDSFWDCYPHGTYNQDVATDAARAYNKNGTPSPGNCTRNGTVEQVVCMTKGNDCVCFTYADNGSGAYVGLARKTTQPAACTCAFGGGDKMDIPWN